MKELIAALTERGPQLSEQVIAGMYQDPFWGERFGERGRRHSSEDGQFHLRYLLEALRSGESAVMANYARWLRTVLTSRGMCTRHLEDNLDRLAQAIRQQGVPQGERAVEVLTRAREALRHPGAAGELQGRAAGLADQACQGASTTPEAGRELHQRLEEVVSYLADGLASNEPGAARSYLAWLQPSYAARGHSGVTLRHCLDRLEQALGADPTLQPARALLQQARGTAGSK